MAKFKKINLKSKKTWKNALIIGLACITLVGAIVGLSSLFRKSEETTKVVNPTYAVGGLNEKGRYFETSESIYTKDAFECQGLDIELDFKSNISYRVFFYGANDDFIQASSKQDGNFDETNIPQIAKTARIVITPNDDSKISWYEITGYANQLEIKVNKEQKENYLFGAKKFDIDLDLHNKLFEYNADLNVTNIVSSASLGYDTDCTTRIDTKGKKTCTIYTNNIKEEICLVARNYDETGVITDEDYEIVTVTQEFVDCGNGFYSYTFNLVENTTSIRVLMGSSLLNGEAYYKLT